jgi:hypothetical protein
VSRYDTITDHVTLISNDGEPTSSAETIIACVVAMTIALAVIALLAVSYVFIKARRLDHFKLRSGRSQRINIDSKSSTTEISIDPCGDDLCHKRTDVISGRSRDTMKRQGWVHGLDYCRDPLQKFTLVLLQKSFF